MRNRRSSSPYSPARRRSPLSGLITVLVVVLVLLAGGMWFLSTLATEKPLARVEKPVSNEILEQ